jgi:hypothetical protein
MPVRDLTQKQFDAKCERRGFRRAFMGYYEVGHGLSVYARNAGERRRDQLAYLIREAERAKNDADGDNNGRIRRV